MEMFKEICSKVEITNASRETFSTVSFRDVFVDNVPHARAKHCLQLVQYYARVQLLLFKTEFEVF